MRNEEEQRGEARRIVLLALPVLALMVGCRAEEPGFPAPPDFYWGTATAAHQVEGGNCNDWTVWEALPGKIDRGEQSGQACDQYHRYPEDLALARELGHNAYRLSLEWSRIEPERDRYDPEALRHYRDVLAAARANGLTPFVTLHHFTHPRWVLDPGAPERDLDGWRNEAIVEELAEFAGDMGEEFGDLVDWWSTINEPTVLATSMYVMGGFPSDTPPFSLEICREVLFRLMRAHAAAYHALHARDSRDADRDGQPCQVGLAHHYRVMLPADPTREADVRGAAQVDYVVNRILFDVLVRGLVDADTDGDHDSPGTDPVEGYHPELAGTLDYLGLNYYSRSVVTGLRGLLYLEGIPAENPDPGVPHNELGWEISPMGFHEALTRLGQEGLPILVTENGIPDAADAQRPRFLVEHLQALERARQEGVPVRGYLHWSLIDNFEWTHGFAPRFGLVAVDYATQRRTPRPSAWLYRDIIRAGGVTPELAARAGVK